MKAIFFIWFLLASLTALAQDDFYTKVPPKPASQRYVVTLRDGSKLVGNLIREDSTETVIQTKNLGQVTLKTIQIASIKTILTDYEGAATRDYPNLFPQYLNYTPTAYPTERGRLYYRNSLLFYSQFDYGVTSNWSVGAGLFTIPLTSMLSLNTKVSFPVGKTVRLGVQGQYVAGSVYFLRRERFNFSYVQGIASIGTSQRNVTVGLGTVFDRGELGAIRLLTLGIVRKINLGLTFISENHILLGSDIDANLFLSGGLRFDRRRHSFDVAVTLPIIPGSNLSITLLPYASYQVRIGK